jgi:hypothetical protein
VFFVLYLFYSYWYGGQYQDIQTAQDPYHDPRAVCLSCIAYQNKNYTFNWLNTLHVNFTIPRNRLECWYRPVQKPCIDWYYWSIHRYLFVYVLINFNFTSSGEYYIYIIVTDIALHINNYCVYCIEVQNLTYNINASLLQISNGQGERTPFYFQKCTPDSLMQFVLGH